MADDAFVSLKELAEQLGTDRSQFRRYVLNLGYTVHKRRTQGSGGQLTLCVSTAEANEIVARRTEQGFVSSTAVAISDVGVFYVIQLVPELDPQRLKLGFAESISQRHSQHRTAAPTAKVLHTWPCKRSWELRHGFSHPSGLPSHPQRSLRVWRPTSIGRARRGLFQFTSAAKHASTTCGEFAIEHHDSP